MKRKGKRCYFLVDRYLCGRFRSNKAFPTNFDALSSQPVSDPESGFSIDAIIRNLKNKAVDSVGVEGRFDVQIELKDYLVFRSSSMDVQKRNNGSLAISVWEKATMINVEGVLVGDPKN